MLEINLFGPVTRFDLARRLPGRWPYWTTAYLVDGMLVDSGCAHAASELLASLADTPLETIVNTHTHEDHIGANGPLQQQRKRLTILAHPDALAVLADPRHQQPLHPYRRLFWGWPEPSEARPIADGAVIQTERYSFRVIYTPGHSLDHLCLYEPDQGWLFSGDLFVGGRDRALRAGTDIWGVIASLKRVAALPIAWLFPGSARVRQSPAQELSDKIAFYEALGEQILDYRQRGWSVAQITRKVCGAPMQVEWVTLGHFARRHLVRAYLQMG
ncbi:MAG: MBL fold metallo-hydrolase [Chloroflexota bacterium]